MYIFIENMSSLPDGFIQRLGLIPKLNENFNNKIIKFIKKWSPLMNTVKCIWNCHGWNDNLVNYILLS